MPTSKYALEYVQTLSAELELERGAAAELQEQAWVAQAGEARLRDDLRAAKFELQGLRRESQNFLANQQAAAQQMDAKVAAAAMCGRARHARTTGVRACAGGGEGGVR